MSEAAQRIVHYSVRDGIAVITLNNPPVNSLGNALRAAIMEYLKKAEGDPAVKGAVLIGSAKAFSGGADIREFNKPREKPDLAELNDQQDAMTKPLVAAIGGFALGGGLELALACHFRIALPKSQLGLPEVKLGILPGSGGTQRLPRIIAMAEALRMMTSGNPIPAEKAKQLGLVDEIAEGDLLESALLFLAKLLKEGRPRRRIRDMQAKVDGDPKAFFAQVREQVAKESKGYPAPLEIVACAEAAATQPFDQGRKFEREPFAHLVNPTESKALRHMFFAERQTTRIPGVPEDTPVREIRKAAVVGAGTMGGGIAMCFANAGIPVTVVEMKQEALDRGLSSIRTNYAGTVAKGRLKQEEMERRMSLITPSLKLEDMSDADIIVEAVFERMDVKQDLFKKLDVTAKPGAILATNTSTLDVDQIAEATQRPQDVIGTHFFSPANVMRLLEKYVQQSLFLLDEGATPAQVDAALQKWGLAMGPFAMYDMAGNDIGWEIRKRRAKERPDMVYSKFADRICELGRFGQKTGKGFYRYEAGDRKPVADPEVETLLQNYRKEIGVEARQISDEEIIARCMYALANEGAYILEEGIALRASDIDMVYLTGYGFPPYRGGPMFHADSVGLDKVLAAIERFQKGYQGAQWKPAPLLTKFAKEGKRFNV